MKLAMEEQKRALSAMFITEALRNNDANREEIMNFKQACEGDSISKYLIHNAWEDDLAGNTKVFLVKDRETGQIVFYYALNCGILYSEFRPLNLPLEEKEMVEGCIEALKSSHDKNLTNEERDKAADSYLNLAEELYDNIQDTDRVNALLALIEERASLKEEKEEALVENAEGEHIKQVKETFPAIDIKFLGRNRAYQPGIELDFKLGVYVFWEMIVPHILQISNLLGCRYVYLFAADNSETTGETVPLPAMYTPDYDPYDDEDAGEEVVRKLIQYYSREFKFKLVSEYSTEWKILKPHYERSCFTMIQEVADLEKNKEIVWASHDESGE